MGYDEEHRMERLPGFIKAVRDNGKGYERIASQSEGLPHSSVRSVEKGTQRKNTTTLPNPTILTLKKLAPGLGISLHHMAHLAFDLPDPEDLGEMAGTIGEICEQVQKMDEGQRLQVLGAVKVIKGGDSQAHSQAADPDAGYG